METPAVGALVVEALFVACGEMGEYWLAWLA